MSFLSPPSIQDGATRPQQVVRWNRGTEIRGRRRLTGEGGILFSSSLLECYLASHTRSSVSCQQRLPFFFGQCLESDIAIGARRRINNRLLGVKPSTTEKGETPPCSPDFSFSLVSVDDRLSSITRPEQNPDENCVATRSAVCLRFGTRYKVQILRMVRMEES